MTSISTPSGAATTKWRCPNSYQSASKVASNPKCRTRAVVAEVQRELGERVAEAAERYDDPWEQLRAGCRAFLAAGSDPAVRRNPLARLLSGAMNEAGLWLARSGNRRARTQTEQALDRLLNGLRT